MNMTNLLYSLPLELQRKVLTYDPEHREKMNAVFHEIHNIEKCQTCGKCIVQYVYSSRRGDEVCCSEICVDNYHHRF